MKLPFKVCQLDMEHPVIPPPQMLGLQHVLPMPDNFVFCIVGACRPLRSRVEQILLSEHGPLILYQLTNLIRFYYGLHEV